jgi:hypothetical protein
MGWVVRVDPQASGGPQGRGRAFANRVGRAAFSVRSGSVDGAAKPPNLISDPRMDTLIQQIINGLVLGSVYALVALGYTMVYGIINLINFAHGDVLMVGR